ncbi:MAG TPA: hypothetical protein VMU19_07510 [Bryobacteraceae bacterium]|nr:hypothetical protein [Bryobacteraceae bacterium]
MHLKLLLAMPLLCCAAFSQAPSTPPPVIRIVSTPVETARTHNVYCCGQTTVDVLGLEAETGAPLEWMIEMHPSFASIEGQDQALRNTPTATLGGDTRAMIAMLQAGRSYLPEDAMRALPRSRYILVTIYRIRPEMETEFEALPRVRRAGNPDLFYRVVSGDDSGTYVRFSPVASLRALDDAAAVGPEYSSADVQAKAAAIEYRREHRLFRMDPKRSYVSDAFAAVDPGFWRP